MNYNKIYLNLINRAKDRILYEYTETHHIIPKCMGGNDDIANLVELTPEEHYLAHQLLIKIYPENKLLLNAAVMMIAGRPSNKLYGWLKRKHSLNMSESQKGIKNSQHGTKWIHSLSEKKSKKIEKYKSVPDGWQLGRVLDWNKENMIDNCSVCGKEKDSKRMFCSHSCSAKFNVSNRTTIFDKYLDDIIRDYKNGMSIYRCLISRGLCGTGANFTKLKKILDSVGGKSIGADTTL